jgi:hypothetical protein
METEGELVFARKVVFVNTALGLRRPFGAADRLEVVALVANTSRRAAPSERARSGCRVPAHFVPCRGGGNVFNIKVIAAAIKFDVDDRFVRSPIAKPNIPSPARWG